MSATRKQMAADLAAVLADPHGPAVDININGVDLQAMRQLENFTPAGEYEGVNVERERVFLLQEKLGFVFVPWSEVSVDGRRWSVESVVENSQVLEVVFVRYLS